MTNREFANAVGCSATMASRMRNGKRAPSVSTLRACIEAFDLNPDEALDHAATPAGWGGYLRQFVFSRTSARAHAESTVRVKPEGSLPIRDMEPGVVYQFQPGGEA